jgi:hypothetical protein
MTTESLIFDALKTLVANRVYPDVGPPGVVRPYITYQQAGGRPVNFLEGTTPSKENSRMQINVWATTRPAAKLLAKQAEAALCGTAALQTTVLGKPVAVYEEDTKLFGTRQDFSFWTST